MQNYFDVQLSISKNEQPLPFPHVIGYAKFKSTEVYHPVEFNKANVNALTMEFFLLVAIIY